jgi:hypothetical protein
VCRLWPGAGGLRSPAGAGTGYDSRGRPSANRGRAGGGIGPGVTGSDDNPVNAHPSIRSAWQLLALPLALGKCAQCPRQVDGVVHVNEDVGVAVFRKPKAESRTASAHNTRVRRPRLRQVPILL